MAKGLGTTVWERGLEEVNLDLSRGNSARFSVVEREGC